MYVLQLSARVRTMQHGAVVVYVYIVSETKTSQHLTRFLLILTYYSTATPTITTVTSPLLRIQYYYYYYYYYYY